MEFFRNLGAAIMGLLATHGYWALFFLLAIEEAGVWLPLPGDTLVMYGGYQAYHGHMNGFAVLGAAIAGSYVGAMTLYFVSLKGGHRLLLRYGKYIHLHPERVERMERWFRRYGIWAIIIARMIPGLRIATTVMAGVFAVPFHIFALGSFIGVCIWAVFYYALGIIVGESYLLLHDALGSYFRTFLIVGAMALGLFGIWFWIRRRNRSRRPKPRSKPLWLAPESDPSDGC